MNIDNLKENIQHGDSMLPLRVYHNENITGNNILYCHWHKELEFSLVTDGKASFQVGTDHYTINAGEAIFINSQEIHAGFSVENSPCSFSAVVFDPELLCSSIPDACQSKYIDPLIKKQLPIPVHIKGDNVWEKDIIEKLTEIMQLYSVKPNGFELSVKAYLYLIFSSIIYNANVNIQVNNPAANNDVIEKLKSLLNYVHANYDKKISIYDLSKISNMSEGHLHRFFKRHTRKTPVDYINQYRIYKASERLKNGNEKISEIASDTGFDNISYFNGIFKQYMGCTPKEYRVTSTNGV